MKTILPSQELADELDRFTAMRDLLPLATQQEIERRVAAWQRLLTVQTKGEPERAAAPVTSLLVMRPGTIPRPIDAFFFEIINRV